MVKRLHMTVCQFVSRPSIIGVSLLIMMLAATTANAANTFYVDPVNGSMANDGSSAKPWRTIQEVFSNGLIETRTQAGILKNAGAPVKSGDTIYLRSGYHGEINYFGAYNTDYITITAEDGHTPQLKQVRFNGAAKWIIHGLTISPSLAPSFERVTIVNFYSRTSNGKCYDMTVEDCFIYTVLDTSSWSASDWDTRSCTGINLGYEGLSGLVARNNRPLNVNFGINAEAENALAEYNTIENFAGDGIRTTFHGVTAQYNVIKNSYDVNDNHDDGIQGYLANVGMGEVRNVTLRGNIIINHEDDNQPHAGPMQGIGCFAGPFPNWVIENNVVMTDHWHGITIYLATNARVFNNTIFSKWYHKGLSNRVSWIDVSGATSDATRNIVRNNISQYYTLEDVITADHNLTVTRATDVSQWFTDYENFDMSLIFGSPAIDAGIADDAPTTDITGKMRPIGFDFDAGAYEFGQEGPYIAARHIFYNNSAFDKNNPTANADDDNAIAPDKTPLLPGQTATFANYTSYSRGINGIMIDIGNFDATLTADDFEFNVGNTTDPGTWPVAAAPNEINIRPAAGINGTTRVTVIFPDNTITKQWLKVTVKANESTGLHHPDIFYVGNAMGDTGDLPASAVVNATDEINCRNNPRHFAKPATLDDPHDHNRDGKVDATDEIICRNNTTNIITALYLITAP